MLLLRPKSLMRRFMSAKLFLGMTPQVLLGSLIMTHLFLWIDAVVVRKPLLKYLSMAKKCGAVAHTPKPLQRLAQLVLRTSTLTLMEATATPSVSEAISHDPTRMVRISWFMLKVSAKVFYAKELQSSQRKAMSVGLSR